MTEDLEASPFAEVTAVVSRTPRRAQEFATAYGIPHALALDDLAEVDAEVVYLALPHDRHAPVAQAALAAGHHVLVEKAFTLDATEARATVAAAEQHGRFLMEAMWMRFNPVIRGLQRLVAAGALGEPRMVHGSFGRAVPHDRAHRLWDPARGGGCLLDQAVYPLTLADLVLGAPAEVVAIGSTLDPYGQEAGVVTEASVLLGYGDGRQASTVSSLRAALPRGAVVGATEALVRIDEPFWCAAGFTIERPGAEPEHVRSSIEGRGYVPMLRAVHEAVSEGRHQDSTMPWATSVAMMTLLDTIRAQVTGSSVPSGMATGVSTTQRSSTKG